MAENITFSYDSGENSGKDAFGDKVPICRVPGGFDVYARASSNNQAPESTATVMVYALGGG